MSLEKSLDWMHTIEARYDIMKNHPVIQERMLEHYQKLYELATKKQGFDYQHKEYGLRTYWLQEKTRVKK